MATSKKGGKKAPGKTKAKTKITKKARPKASAKNKTKIAKKAKKASVKSKVKPKAKVSKKAKAKVASKNKTKAVKRVKKAPVKAKSKVVKKAKPKALPKTKIEAPEKIKESVETVPQRKITKEAVKPARISRGGSDFTVALDRMYIVGAADNIVTLEVNAGDRGQTSDMTIKLDDKVVANEIAGDFNETTLGTNKELTGKKLSIVATIADTSRETNLTSLTIHLKGGFIPETFPLSKEVDQEGQSVDYLCLIEFLRPG
jgi:hypothetical protein